MKLSAPLHILNSRAKQLKKDNNIPLTQALDQVAQNEGYMSWSLLKSKADGSIPHTKEDILEYLNPGDLLIVGSRPKLGKTMLVIDILSQAIDEGRQCYFFSLEFTQSEATTLFTDKANTSNLLIDVSNDISAQYIIEKIGVSTSSGSIIVIDYLQLLDQKRSNQDIQTQIKQLKNYATTNQCIVIFISQLDRSLGEKEHLTPSTEDIRMPNLFDLALFNKILVMDEVQYSFVKPKLINISK